MGWIAAIEGTGEETARDGQAAVDIGARKEDRELVATDPERAIVAAQRRLDDLADRDEEPVAAGMAAFVVDALEVVDIDEQQRERRFRASGVLQLTGELLLEASVIAESSQAVEQRILPSAAIQLAQPRVLVTEQVDIAQQRSRSDAMTTGATTMQPMSRSDGDARSRPVTRPEALEGRDPHQDDEDGGEDQRHPTPDIVRRWIGAYLHVPRRSLSQGGAP